MADAVKELVSKWRLDLSSWPATVKSAQETIEKAAQSDAARVAASNKGTQQAITLLTKEIALTQQITAVKEASSKVEKGKSLEIQKQNELAAAAAKQALEAINTQIAAERLKEAASKAALAEQRRAASEAIAIAKNAMATQKQIQIDAEASAKAAFAANTKAAAAASSKSSTPQVPIVTTVSQNQPLPERDGARVDNRTTAQATAAAAAIEQGAALDQIGASAEGSAAAVVSAQKAVQVALDASTEKYRAQAIAQEELRVANVNLAETRKALGDGTLSGKQGETRLASDLAAQAVAKKAYADAQVASEDKILLAKQAQARQNLILEEQEAELARREELILMRKEYELKVETELNEAYAINARMEEAKARAANATKFQLSMSEEMPEHFHSRSSVASSGGSALQRDRALVDFASGRPSIRPLESLLTKIPGATAFASMVFPIMGATMFFDMMKSGYDGVKAFLLTIKEFPDKVINAFDSARMGLVQTNDQLKLADDNIKNAIAKLEHKPTNNLVVALDEALIKTDELYKKAIAAQAEFKKLLEDTKISMPQKILKGQTDISDEEQQLLNKKETDIKNATKGIGDAQRDLTNLGPRTKNESPEAATLRRLAEENLAQAHSTYTGAIDAKSKYAQQLIYNQTNDTTRGLNGKPLDNSIVIDKLQGVIDYDDQRKAEVPAEKKVVDDTEKQKQIQEAIRLGQISLRDAEAEAANKKKLAAEIFEDAKSRIEALTEVNASNYRQGLLMAKKFYDDRKALAQQSYEAELAEIETTRVQDQALLLKRKNTAGSDITAARYKSMSEGIDHDAARKQTAARSTRDKTDKTVDVEQQSELTERLKKEADIRLDAKLKALQLETDAVKSAFKEQLIDGDQYLAASAKNIQNELAAKTLSIYTQIALNGILSKSNEELWKQLQVAGEDATRKKAELDSNAFETRVGYEKGVYGSKTSLASAKLAQFNAPNSGATTEDRLDVNQQQQFDLTTHISYLETMRSQAVAYSKDWKDISTEIVNAKSEMLTLQMTSKNLIGSSAQLGGMFGGGASAFSGLFTSRYAKGFERALGGAASTAENAQSNVDTFTSGRSFSDIFSAKPGGMFSGDSGSVSTGISDFTAKIKGAVSALGSFISSIANAGSASAGGVAGGLAGASLGQSASKSITEAGDKMGGGLGDAMSALGPFAGLIGGAAGAGLGAIMGQKQETVQNDVDKLNATFKSTMASFSSNNSSLATTINSLHQLIGQAQMDMASTKKGGSQFKDLIKQYNDQIMQLEEQQKTTMAQLTNSLTIMGQAAPYQDMLNNIQSILTQYEQFAGAAQNATQLANANLFLTQSLQQLGTSYTNQLLQNETTAVQDALQLNDLYNQRNQLQKQFLDQTLAIVGQGTITRSLTQSQTKFSKLYDLDVQHSNAMDNINTQIATAQYKVQAEQQIFNLATTKQGLEAQLVALQERGINLDMGRIAAMQNLLAILASTGYSITDLGGLDTSDPNALIALLLKLLTGMLGNGSNASKIAGSSGNSLLQTILGSSYQNQLGFGYNGSPRV